MIKEIPRRLLKDLLYSKSDVYYRKAKEDCYRARSAYKLLQIDQLFQLFQHAERVIDLCAAPGSWSQVCAQKLKPKAGQGVRIISVDLQEMAPIEGVVQVQGDITSKATFDLIRERFNGQSASLVLSDGAPDVTGLHDMDQYLQSQLMVAALNFCINSLEKGGCFVGKVFKGSESNFLYSQFKAFFKAVYLVKPHSSRESSVEYFVVCLDFAGREGVTALWSMGGASRGTQLAFYECGDLSCYDEI